MKINIILSPHFFLNQQLLSPNSKFQQAASWICFLCIIKSLRVLNFPRQKLHCKNLSLHFSVSKSFSFASSSRSDQPWVSITYQFLARKSNLSQYLGPSIMAKLSKYLNPIVLALAEKCLILFSFISYI